MRRSTSRFVVSVAFSMVISSLAQAVDVRFDDVPFQPADGLRHAGVTFDYKLGGLDNSTDAFAGSFGPGTLTNVSDPSLTGNSAGILALSLDIPTPVLEFGAALSTADALSPGLTVQLFRSSGELLETRALNTVSNGVLAFSEGRFTYSGEPISRAVMDFADSPQNFAFYNLVFEVPEPWAASLMMIGSFALLPVLRRRQR